MKYRGTAFKRFIVTIIVFTILTTLLLCATDGFAVDVRSIVIYLTMVVAGWCGGGMAAWTLSKTPKFPALSLILWGCSIAAFSVAEELLISGWGIFLLPFFWLPVSFVLSMMCPFILRFNTHKQKQ